MEATGRELERDQDAKFRLLLDLDLQAWYAIILLAYAKSRSVKRYFFLGGGKRNGSR